MNAIVCRRSGLALALVLSGTAACSERTEDNVTGAGAPIVVVAAPEAPPPAPLRTYIPAPEIEAKVVETSLAASDMVYESEGEVTALKRVADPYRTSDSILPDTLVDHGGIASVAPTGASSL